MAAQLRVSQGRRDRTAGPAAVKEGGIVSVV